MVTVKVEEREQLYMLEFLVSQLTLNDEILQKSGGDLAVHIKFLDFPDFVIKRDDSKAKSEEIKFGSGESCVFSKKPKDLVEKLTSNPLTIDVRKVKDDCTQSEPENPICTAVLELSGCFCQIESAMTNPHQLPEPYIIKNSFNLLDDNEKPSGSIELFLRLSCLGESIVTHFHVDDDAFLFKNMNSVDEFACTKLLPTEEEMRDKFWTPRSKVIDIKKKPQAKTIVGISTICEQLVEGDRKIVVPKLALEKLNERNKTHNGEQKNDDFNDLQTKSADFHEKSNFKTKSADFHEKFVDLQKSADLQAKSAVFNEKIVDLQKSADFQEKSDILSKFDSKTFISPRKFPCHGKPCPGGLCSGISSSTNDIFQKKSLYKPRGLEKNRLRGGMDFNVSTIPIQSMQTLLTGACRTYSPSDDPRPGCGCQDSTGKSKKKCCGIDCLIKSFKEAEKFVDGIGKVPGMAGLGLMDPTESPFFGRHRPKLPTKCRAPQINQIYLPRKSSSILRAPPSKIFEKLKPTKKVNEKNAGDGDLMAIKEPQVGPCGEEICKSRKKEEVPSRENSRSLKMRKMSTVSTKRKNKKLNLKKAKNLRNYERNYGHVKVGKRVMRLVEATSQGCCYGHRSCVDIRTRVPGNMGWLWNTSQVPGRIKPRVGWRPGAISRGVWRILEESKVKDAEELEERSILAPVKGKKGKMSKSKSLLSLARSQKKRRDKDEGSELPPTLHVHRKNGDYYITMHPVNPENSPEIQAEVKPLQFKVTRNRSGENDSADSSSVGDDMEIEFSPPTAIHRQEKKAERKDLEIQVAQSDILEAFKTSDAGAKKKKKGGKK